MKAKTECRKCGGSEFEPKTYLKDVDALIVECVNCGHQGEIDQEKLCDYDKEELEKLKEADN